MTGCKTVSNNLSQISNYSCNHGLRIINFADDDDHEVIFATYYNSS